MSSNLIKHVLPSALVVCKNKSYHRYHLGLCQQPILPIPFYLSSPLCLTCLSFPSSMLFLCLTCSRRLFVPKCQEGKAVIYWKILLDSWPAVWNVRAELFTVKEEEEKRISIPTIPWLTALPPGVYAVCHLTSFCPSPGIGSISCWPSCEKQPCESRRK